ncbi:MAG: autotransporter-associated beta strand repeat-containing protein, partial [Planctomycetia bacterium]|nr:autotransporter-associated beta strand repeat-containing protein [Planctomycetia bacterium]
GGRVVKAGAGRMVLTGSNTFTGGLTLSAGQLDLNNASALGSGTFTITGGTIGNSSGSQINLTTNNAQLWNADVAFVGPNILNLGTGTATLNASRTVTVSAAELIVGSVSGAGFGLTKAGAGKLSLSGSIAYTGPTDVTSGTLQFGIGGTTGALSPSSTISGSAGATLFFARSNTVTQGVDFAGVIGGALNVTQGVSGTLVLNGANTYTGTTRIVAGSLSLGGTAALQNSTLDLNAADTGTLVFGVSGTNTYAVGGLIGSRSMSLPNTVVLSVGGNGSSGTYSGVISGSGGLTKSGAGTLTLGNVQNSFTGGTIVNGGTLTLGNGGQNGNIRGSLTINQGATVNADANAWSLGYGGTRAGAEWPGASVTSIAINGGLLNITNPVSGAGLSANTIVLAGGTIGGGSFGWYNTNTLTPVLQTLASSTRSTLSGGISLRLSTSGTLTFDVASGSTSDGLDLVVSGPITNAGTPLNNGGSLAKTGAGTLLLSGLNTFTGGVTVTGGTLATQGVNVVSGGIPGNTNLTITNATTTTTGTQFNALSQNWSSGTVTINPGGLLFAGNSTNNAHNIFSVVLAGGTMASGTGSLGTALANWYVNGGITATGSTTSSISASLGRTSVTTNQSLAVTVDPGSTLSVSGPIVNLGGANGLTKSGSGLLVLSGTNTFSGGLTLSAGQVDVNSATALGAGTFTIAGGTIGNSSGAAITHTNNVAQAWNADVTFVGPSSLNLGTGGVTLGASRTVAVSTGSLTVGGVISGGGFSLTKTGTGTLTLTGTNTYTGGTVVDGGTLTLVGKSSFDGVIRGSLTINAGDTANASQNWALGAGGTNSSAPTSRSVTDVTINGGTLNFTNDTIKGGMSPTTVTMTGGSITGDDFQWYYGNSSTVSLVTQASSTTSTVTPGVVLRLNKTAGVGVLTLDVASGTAPGGADLLISGQIRNAPDEGAGGRLVKTGAGTLVLSGNNTFTDGLTLSAGQVNVNSATALGTGRFTIAGGTIGNSSGSAVTLTSNNAQSWNGDFGFAGPSSLTLGSGAVTLGASRTVTVSTGTLTVNGVISGSGFALTKTGAGTLSLGNVVSTYSGGTVVDGGTLTLGGLGASGNNGVIRGSLTINQGATVNADAKGWSLGYGGTRAGAAFSGNSVTSITINGGLLNFTNPEAGAGLAANSIVLTGGTIGGSSFGWIESNTLTPTLQTLASSTRSTLVGGISLRLSASGELTFDVASGSTSDGLDLVVSGSITDSTGGRVVKTGAGTLVLAGTNTYAGTTTVSAGTLALSGGWNGTVGQVTVANVAGTNATVAIQSGSYGFGGNSLLVGNAATSVGIVNQTGGTVTFTGGTQLLIGTGSGGVGGYTLSGGAITTATSTLVGVMLGVNPNSSGTFTMTGGALNMTAATGGGADATLLIGRFSATGENGQSGAFTQSGGVASVGILSIGGSSSTAGTGGTQVLTLTGGTFAANQFPRLSAGNSNVATITIGGSADVTLPAFPTARGTGATATVYFDGGILRPAAASASYMSGLTNAFIRSGGITFNVPTGSDVTVGQTLLADGTLPGGGLVKTGAGTLTLGNVTNTYSGGTIVNGGALTLGNGGASGNIRGSLTINQGATVNSSASGWSLGYGGTRSGASYSGTSVTSIAINGGLLNITNGTSGAGLAANSLVLTGGTIGGASFGWINTNTLTPTLQTLASSARSTLSGGISLRLSTSGTLTFDVASGSTTDGIDLLVSGPITDATAAPDNIGGRLAKIGGGTMVLSGSNTYTGATSISGGRLRVDSTGSINATSGITINGGELRYNSATAFTRPLTFTAGTISGTGTIGTAVIAAAGDILSPGNSPGSQAYTAGLTWSGSGSYLWELNALTGTAGVNWDLINVSGGTFNLAGLSTGSRFILDLTTLTGANALGPLDIAYDGGAYAFPIATYTSLSTPLGTAALTDLTSLFDIRRDAWAAPKPSAADISVRINSSSNGLELVIVPEPGTIALAAIGVIGVAWALRRRG